MPDGRRIDVGRWLKEIRASHAIGFFSFDGVVDTFTHCFAAPVKDSHGNCVATVCIVASQADAALHSSLYRAELLKAAKQLSSLAS